LGFILIKAQKDLCFWFWVWMICGGFGDLFWVWSRPKAQTQNFTKPNSKCLPRDTCLTMGYVSMDFLHKAGLTKKNTKKRPQNWLCDVLFLFLNKFYFQNNRD